MNLFDGTDLLETTSTEVKNRILKPGQMLRAIDTGALYYGDKDGKPTAFVGASTSSSGGVVFGDRRPLDNAMTGYARTGIVPMRPVDYLDGITMPLNGGGSASMALDDSITVDGKVVIRWGSTAPADATGEVTNPFGFNLGQNATLTFMVGGAAVTQAFADSIGADAYCADAVGAVRAAKNFM